MMQTVHTVKKVQLSPRNEKYFKAIFNKSFDEKWKPSVPFPADPVYAVYEEDRPVGFCMVHDAPPYPFLGSQSDKVDTRPYMYNLCVDPAHRGRGVATAIIEHLKSQHTDILAHMTTSSDSQWFEKRGFNRIGVWRGNLVEYSSGTVASNPVKVLESTPYYDPEENCVYLSL